MRSAKHIVDSMASGYLLGLYEKSMPDSLSLREKLLETKAAGYDFLELSIDETEKRLARLQWTDEQRREVKAAVEETAVPIRSLCLSGHRRFPLGHPAPEIREKSLQIMAGAVDLAADLGVRIIQIAGYDVYYEPGTDLTRKLFGQNLRRCVEMAAKAGVILAFETMETDFLNTVEKAMYWVREINSPYLQVYPDAGNITNAAVSQNKSVIDDMLSGKGHLVALHLKETRPGVFREVPYGTGHVDFAAVTRQAYRMGVRRYLAEFWYMGQENWRETLRGNCRFLRQFLDAAERNQAEDGTQHRRGDEGSRRE